MNRLVREYYPVSKLPGDLREGFEGDRDVTVIVEASAPSEEDRESAGEPGSIWRYRHLAKSRFTSDEEINAHVCALRNEWDRSDR